MSESPDPEPTDPELVRPSPVLRGPNRLVLARGQVGYAAVQRLECGHTVQSRGLQGSSFRRCPVCAGKRADIVGEFIPDAARVPAPEGIERLSPAPPASDDGLTEIGRVLLRLLPPPGEPFPPERREAYLATARALFEYTWGGRDGDY